MSYDSELAIGIDLGTTNSTIGYWNNDINEVELIPNSIGEFLTPSVVIFNGDEYLVGEQTQKCLIPKGEKINSIKRIIGRNFSDKNLQNDIKYLNYKIINKNNLPIVEIKNNNKIELHEPEYISYLILKKLIESAENFLKNKIKKVVITVPAHFNDAQRTATKSAAEKLGLEDIKLLNEPTAAGLLYGFGQNWCPKKKYENKFIKLLHENRKKKINKSSLSENFSYNSFEIINNDIPKNILVFDLGGGTYDLAILKIENDNISYKNIDKIIKVLSKKAMNIGGDNFDENIFQYCFKDFIQNKTNINNPQEILSYKNSRERLIKACEHIKRILSKEKNAMLKINNFYKENDLIINLTREQFENEICKDLFDKLSEPFDDLLSEAHLIKNDINEIILVGGSSKMPKIKEILKNYFQNSKINFSINPDEIVAYGATIFAGMIINSNKSYSTNELLKNVKLEDITPFSLGTDTIDKKTKKPKMDFIIPKGTIIPTNLNKPFIKEYKTVYDNQEDMLICIYEGENLDLNKNNLLGEFRIFNLPKKPKGKVTCVIEFHIDENNILTVTGKEKKEGSQCGIQIMNGKQFDLDEDMKQIVNSSSTNEICENEGEKKLRFNEYIDNLCDSYSGCQNDKDKYNKLIKYEEAMEDLLQDINIQNLNQENIIEKYYLYVYQLFEAYVEMFFLDEEIINKNDIENKVKNKVIKYLNNLKSKNIYYIKSLVSLFEEIKDVSENNSLFFYSLILDEIEIFNNIALSYIDFENKQKYSRYNAKLYFTESIKLFDKYINSSAKTLLGIKNSNKIKNLQNTCTTKLEEINNNAILLINVSKKNRRLINQAEVQQQINSGFTILENNFLYNHRTNEEYILILDEYEKTLDRIEISLKNKKKLQSNEGQEEKAICLGSIVKIKFEILGQKKYKENLNNIEKCIYIAKNILNKNENDCEWYKEALDLQKNILNKIEEDKNEKIKKIDEIFKKKDNIYFINYILMNYPYKGYDRNIKEEHIDWDKLNINLLDYLIDKYNKESYEKNSDEQKIEHIIIENILGKLRSLQDKFKNYTNDMVTNY